MGIHIVNIKNGEIIHQYVTKEKDLLNIDLDENSIIYQGDEQYKPILAGKSDVYSKYCNDICIAGMKAEITFKKQAKENQLIVEEIIQDKESFSQYIINTKPIKRGDFLIRNYGNIEIDVKCRSFYKINEHLFFKLEKTDLAKHLNMQSITQCPIYLAIYQRNGKDIISDSIYFISINNINQNKKNWLDEDGIFYQIPIHFTIKGFNDFKNIIIKEKNKKLSNIEKQRKLYPNAYEKWTEDEDYQLEILYCKRKSIKELSLFFGRNNGAIKSRIKKLELDLKYNFDNN